METQVTSRLNKALLIINGRILAIGNCGGPLVMRLYFIKKALNFYTPTEAISGEAKAFELGQGRYYVVIICIAIILQFYFLGTIGVIYSASSLVSGILATFLLPVTEVLAVFLYGEKFSAEKGISLALSLWGFASYFYGDYKENNKRKNDQSPETKTIDKTNCTRD